MLTPRTRTGEAPLVLTANIAAITAAIPTQRAGLIYIYAV
jgi:hypothetical protein